MALWSQILNLISSIFKPAVDLIDELHTSEEEKLKIKAEMEKTQIELAEKMLEYETKLVEARSDIIVAEAQGASFIQRNWRPIVMLAFTGIIIAFWFGLTNQNISEEIQKKLLEVVEYGLVGYIGGRTVEKVTSVFAFSRKDRNKIPQSIETAPFNRVGGA